MNDKKKVCKECKFYGAPAYRGSVCIGHVCKRTGITHVGNDVCEQWEVSVDE